MTERRRRPWRENLEAVTMAVVMALLLKTFIVEAYKIPTGSMQPTLIGDEGSGLQDRILVDKLSFVFRDPERWDVVVFRYPLDSSQNFVKRLVGVGPEELKIDFGDLWHRKGSGAPWTVLRRPRHVRRAQWKVLDVEEPRTSSWRLQEGAGWELEGRTALARGPGTIAFRPGDSSVVDRYFDGYPEEVLPYLEESRRFGKDLNPVGDLRLETVVTADAGTAWVEAELREGRRRYRYRVPGPAAPASAAPELVVEASGSSTFLGGQEPAHVVLPLARKLEPGVPTRLAAENVDDLLALELDGEVLLELEVEPAADQSSGARLTVSGTGEARLEELMLSRDVFYLAQGKYVCTIPEGSYFALGDNTQDSSDSREWDHLVYLLHPPEGEEGEPRTLRTAERPDIFGVGEPGGARQVLVDEFGERHVLDPGRLEYVRTEDAPLVPRTMIQGKALAVFWPFDPRRGIYRMNWVH